MIGHALMNSTNKIRTGVGQVETEVTVCIRPGTGRFLHSLAQSDQDNVISGCRLVRGAVIDCARNHLSGERHGKQEEYARNKKEAGQASRNT